MLVLWYVWWCPAVTPMSCGYVWVCGEVRYCLLVMWWWWWWCRGGDMLVSVWVLLPVWVCMLLTSLVVRVSISLLPWSWVVFWCVLRSSWWWCYISADF